VARRILMVAGEASGDAHGGRLALAMREIEPALELSGMGGEHMRAAGVRTSIDSASLSVMGFSDVAAQARRVIGTYRRLARELRSGRHDLVVLIDFPDFNLRLARVAKRAGVRVVYFVSPQVWAWRRGRIDTICERVDRMIVVFPFEADLYRERGLDVHYVGHPLAEEVVATRSAADTRARWGIEADRPLVALLPGSRSKEVARILPVMLEAAHRLEDRACFAIARAPGLAAGAVASLVAAAATSVAVVEADTYNLLAASDVAAVTSGTATVECAVLGRPMVVVYRMSRPSYAIARALVRVRFIAMPNILAGERIVPELIQQQADADHLTRELTRYLDSPELRADTAGRLATVREALVWPGAAERAARLVLEKLA